MTISSLEADIATALVQLARITDRSANSPVNRIVAAFNKDLPTGTPFDEYAVMKEQIRDMELFIFGEPR